MSQHSCFSLLSEQRIVGAFLDEKHNIVPYAALCSQFQKSLLIYPLEQNIKYFFIFAITVAGKDEIFYLYSLITQIYRGLNKRKISLWF